MNTDAQVDALVRQLGEWPIFDRASPVMRQAAARIAADRKRIEELEGANFALAANQCAYGVSGEHGDHVCARIKELEAALREISAQKYATRETVTPYNAWPAFQNLNKKVCAIYDIADRALEGTTNG